MKIPRLFLLIFTLVVTFIAVALFFFNKKPEDMRNLNTLDTLNAVLPNKKPILGAWLWLSPIQLSDAEQNEIFEFAVTQKINLIYVNINDYIDIYELPKSNDRTAKIVNFKNALKSFVKKANENGIKVEAVAGDTLWANDSHWYLAETVIDFVTEYNRENADAKLEGIQFDIEFYFQTAFNNSPQKYSVNYLILLERLLNKLKRQDDPELKIGLAIPFWFDSSERVLKIKYKGETKPLAYHVLDILNIRPGSYIAIMDYRDSADGPDGSITHAINEVKYATETTPNVRVLIGQETTKNVEEKISFYGKTYLEFINEIERLSTAFSSYSAFDGVIVHDLQGFRELVD